jgi:nicotinamide phosphoribosyltransferase
MTNFNTQSILLNTDSYKVGMFAQYPEDVQYVYSYIESRGGIYDEVVAGLVQPFIREYLSKPFTEEDIDFAVKTWPAFGSVFPEEQIRKMFKKYNGYWPVAVFAVPDGSVVKTKNVLAVVVNTDPEFPFATTWIETALLRAAWYTSTVATNSREIKKVIKTYLEKSGDVSGLDFKLHDFGARGASSFETAGLGSLSHAVNFMGSDTMTGQLFAAKYYDATEPVIFSIGASEHSTITSWGRDGEKDAYRNMIKKFAKPGAIFACVSDSYDIYKACHMWGELAEEIKASGATLVVRPDSGDPALVVPTCLRILEQYFGYVTNDKGYKVLNNVRMIWGDGITKLTIETILRTAVDIHGYSADMLAFGQGGALLQAVTRDDQKYAMKCSAVGNNEKLDSDEEFFAFVDWRDVFKDPVTDKGKVSKKGLVWLFRGNDGEYVTDNLLTREDTSDGALICRYLNGQVLNSITFDQVRANASV